MECYLRLVAGIKFGAQKIFITHNIYLVKSEILIVDVATRMIEKKPKLLNLLGLCTIQSLNFLINLYIAYV